MVPNWRIVRESRSAGKCRNADGAQAMVIAADWVSDVLHFWFDETRPDQWCKKDAAFDASIRSRFLALHEVLADRPSEELFREARTALASIIVFDQMSRNMFRNTPRAFATDDKALGIAVAVVAQGLDA